MEQVLRSSNDGILVYVAPTKALVTQITAEIYARFSKQLDGSKSFMYLPSTLGLTRFFRELLGDSYEGLSR